MAVRFVACSAILLIAAVSVNGYSTGAPDGACETLTPKHGNTTPQNGVPPYDFKVSSTNVNGGSKVTVTISKSGDGPSFKGFLLQARKAGGNTPVGKWVPVSGVSRGVKCDKMENTSLTHVDNSEKSQLDAEWIAPAPGSYEIYHTVAQNGGVYWVGHKSQTITVT